jgi:phage protein D
MFNYVAIEFPLSQNPPQRISSFTLKQERYAHEIATARFRDWGVRYTSVKPGDPVRCVLRGKDSSREFVGYVHDIKPNISPTANFTEVTIIGASYRLKQAKQRVFENITSSDVVRAIAKDYNFSSANVVDHPRVFEQVTQAGHTELQLMSRLAKQCGYSLRIENTSIYYAPFTYNYSQKRNNAKVFVMSDANEPGGSTIYSFQLTLGDSVAYKDSYKSAVQVGGINPQSNEINLVTNPRQQTINQTSATEFFDSFATNIVAPNYETAAYEAKAADERNRFPYRARIQVIGTPELKPDDPIYLDGLGPNYTGYWVVMYTEHSVVEQSPNILKYTTIVDVGADSIGQAQVWEGQAVTAPATISVRALTPDIKNVPIQNASLLVEGTGYYNNSGFTEVTNRITESNVKPYTWQAINPSYLNNLSDIKNRTNSVINRLRNKNVL